MRALLVLLVLAAPISASAERAETRTVYLNRNGVTLTPGSNDSRTNRSTLVSQQVSIPPWNVSAELWSDTVMCLREVFVAYDVEITETDPGSLAHVEAVFAGAPAQLDRDATTLGVSPFSNSCKVIESAMVFAFTDALPANAIMICKTMAQEIGHSYGLDHELLAASPMSYLSFAGQRRFQNTLAECGEDTVRPCGAAGHPRCRDKQNSHALLLDRIGAAGAGDLDPPSVAITSPANGASVEPAFQVAATITDGVRVKLASLVIDGITVDTLVTELWAFEAPADLAAGAHLIEIKATDGANETIATIEVTVPGSEDEAIGCSAGGSSGWLVGLLVLGMRRRRRR